MYDLLIFLILYQLIYYYLNDFFLPWLMSELHWKKKKNLKWFIFTIFWFNIQYIFIILLIFWNVSIWKKIRFFIECHRVSVLNTIKLSLITKKLYFLINILFESTLVNYYNTWIHGIQWKNYWKILLSKYYVYFLS